MKKETKLPKVSVLMPIYNTHEGYLRAAIDSILNQTFEDFEFLILNDSPDNQKIKECVLSYKDKRIKYFENDANMGISKSRNKLVDLSRGEYLAVFDHDDISLPRRLEQEVTYLDTHKDVGVVSGNFYYMSTGRKTNYPLDNLSIKIQLMMTCIISHSCCMIRKSVLKSHNIAYEEQYSPAEDHMLMLKLLDKTMFAILPAALLKYRDSENNTTHRQLDKMIDKINMVRCYAYREFPYLAQQWHPLELQKYLKKNRKLNKYKLFGFIPLLSIEEK